MPLRITNGIPITPKPLEPDPEFLLVDRLFNERLSRILPVKRFKQRNDLWCWAACVSMVLDYYENFAEQCEIVGRYLSREDCCNNPYDEEFDVACQRLDMKYVWESWGINNRAHLGTDIQFNGWVNYLMLKNEIERGRPVQIGIGWWCRNRSDFCGGHVIMVRGWRETSGGSFLWVNDSLKRNMFGFDSGVGLLHYDELRSAKGQGLWIATWTNLELK